MRISTKNKLLIHNKQIMAKILSASLVAACMAAMAPVAASAQDYPHNYGENDKNVNTIGRMTNKIQVKTSPVEGTGTIDRLQTLKVDQESSMSLYYSFPDFAFQIQRGSRVNFKADPNLEWQCGYFYIDYGRDGQFDVNNDAVTTFLADAAANKVANVRDDQPELPTEKQWSYRTRAEQGDLACWSYYQGYNSLGRYVRAAENIDYPESTAPDFVVPTDVEPGFYYCRYKVDWDLLDPAGNTTEANNMAKQGGVLVDTRVNIHDENVSLAVVGEGVDLTLEDGTPVNGATAQFNRALTVNVTPKDGVTLQSLVVRHGYNLDGDQTVHGCKQWDETTIDAADVQNGTYKFEKGLIDGNVRITLVTSGETGVNTVNADALTVNAGEGTLTLNAATATKVTVSDAQGRTAFNGAVKGTRTLNLAKGLYIVNGEKYLVK